MKKIETASVAALCILGATVAQAECFGPADLTRGLTVSYDTGDRTTIRRAGDGTHLVQESYASGDPSWALRAHHGVYFVEEWQVEGTGRAEGTGLVIEFPVDPNRLPVPVAGLSWEGQTINHFEGGGSRPETTTLQFNAADPITLSDCTYEIIEANLRYDWGEEGGLNLRYLYFVEIGTAFLEWSEFDDETKTPLVMVALDRATK